MVTSDTGSAGRRLSVVVPVHNEAASIEALVERLAAAAGRLAGWRVNVLLVDDGSTDDSAVRVESLRQRGLAVGWLRLSRNYGHQAAVLAGMMEASGDAVITLDGDLQHPPERIPAMVQAFEAGADVVQMVRRNGQSGRKGLCSRVFYRVFNRLSDTPIVEDAPDFRLLSRRVVEVLRRIPEHRKFLRGLIPSLGFRQVTLPYEQGDRLHGAASYTFRQSARLALRAFFDFSTLPLEAVFAFGVAIALLSFLAGVGFVAVKVIWWHSAQPGFTDLIFAVLFMSGCILMSIGILGRYLVMILEQVRGRPAFLVMDRLEPGELPPGPPPPEGEAAAPGGQVGAGGAGTPAP